MSSKLGNISNVAAKYNRLKFEILPHASTDVMESTKAEMKKLRDGLWSAISGVPNGQKIIFNSQQELASVVSILLDTGKILGLDWVRKSTSKSDPTKTAGSVDTLTVKKVNGYVKGTSGGKKALEDAMSGRVTLWVANGSLQKEGFGNWRSIYVSDIKAIRLGGNVAKVETV